MTKEDIIKKLSKTKAANDLRKIAQDPDKFSDNEIENAVVDIINESLKLEEKHYVVK